MTGQSWENNMLEETSQEGSEKKLFIFLTWGTPGLGASRGDRHQGCSSHSHQHPAQA